MNHILGTLIAALLVSLGFAPSAQATVSVPVEPAATYAYNAAVFDAPSDDSTSQRVPPVRNYDQATFDVADHWSHGAVMYPGAGKAPSITTDTHLGMPCLVAQTMATTVGDSVLAGTEYSLLQQAEVAANTADSAIPKIKPGSAGGPTAGHAFPQSVRADALAENPSTCVYCRMETDAPQVDHAIPRVAGGNATIDNAQTTCPWCNASKGPREFPVNPPPGYEGTWPPAWWNSRP